jgi:hypothetical protein
MLIGKRFNGPPDSGNGGYTAGLVAGHVHTVHPPATAVEVTLRAPPPLGTELTVSPGPDGVAVWHGDLLVATARPAALTGLTEPVPAVTFQQAERISPNYPGFVSHPFPTCYVCGPAREDGLRLFPGRLPDGRTAAPFLVPDDVSTATVWACLDCPGGWTVGVEARPYVLGRITARVDKLPEPGNRCVVTGVLLEEEGRKAHVATTLWYGDEPLAAARATWIALR